MEFVLGEAVLLLVDLFELVQLFDLVVDDSGVLGCLWHCFGGHLLLL